MPLVNTPVQVGYTADGPAAAAIVNQQLNDWQNQQQRDFTTQDINNGINQNTLDNALLNNPLLAAQRATALGQSQNDLANLPVKNEADVAKYIQGKSDAELKVAENRADMTRSYASQLEGLQGPAQQAAFVNIQKEAASKGLQFDSIQDLQSKGQAAVSFMKTSDALKIQAPKLASEERIAAGKNETTLAATRLAYGKSMDDPTVTLKQARSMIASGEALPDEMVSQLWEAFKAKQGDKDPSARIDKLTSELTDARKYEKAKEPDKFAKEAAKVGMGPEADPALVARKQAIKTVSDEVLADFTSSFAGAKVMGPDGKPVPLSSDIGKAKVQDILTGHGSAGGGGTSSATGKTVGWQPVGAPEVVTGKGGIQAQKVMGSDGKVHYLPIGASIPKGLATKTPVPTAPIIPATSAPLPVGEDQPPFMSGP